MADTIHVMAAQADGKVKLWEVHPDHPNGEIFISGDGTSVEVAETAEVKQRLKDGTLVKVTRGKAHKPVADDEPKAPADDDKNPADDKKPDAPVVNEPVTQWPAATETKVAENKPATEEKPVSKKAKGETWQSR